MHAWAEVSIYHRAAEIYRQLLRTWELGTHRQNRRGKCKAILGPAGCALCMWPAGHNCLYTSSNFGSFRPLSLLDLDIKHLGRCINLPTILSWLSENGCQENTLVDGNVQGSSWLLDMKYQTCWIRCSWYSIPKLDDWYNPILNSTFRTVPKPYSSPN